jgi:hypothetical protein
MGGDAEIEEGSLASFGMTGELVEGDLTGRDLATIPALRAS